MRQSKAFTRTYKTAPSDATATNAKLLEQAGFIQKVMAGVYTMMPLGLRVLNKIENIVRREMEKEGASEILMPALHPKENWMATGRWDNMDVLFKIAAVHGNVALGPTHEEIVTPAAKELIVSYKDLPKATYQIQTKFRNEPRAKSGLLRCREFRMKDLYSFHFSELDLDAYYHRMAFHAYPSIFEKLGLRAVITEASGGTFSKFSHEFQVEMAEGEDLIYVCNHCGKARNAEIFVDVTDTCAGCQSINWRATKASEVGNIFKLMDKYSSAFALNYIDNDGSKKPVLMGCYGIGTSRLMGVIAEKFNDANGLVWPEAVAPFKVHLIALPGVEKEANETYETLLKEGVEVLYDDRNERPGVKFAEADMIGIPYRVVVSKKTVENNGVELKMRNEKEGSLIFNSTLISSLKRQTEKV